MLRSRLGNLLISTTGAEDRTIGFPFHCARSDYNPPTVKYSPEIPRKIMAKRKTGNVERRLAAILAMDVVGFSRLMGADEAGTHARLKRMRADIIDPAIAAANGRVVKLMGDGMLVEFDSAGNAVRCAIDIQKQLKRTREGDDGDVLTLRMGINLGDVIVDGDDIYGDGVNIAARLESLANPGGIVVSESIRDSARNSVSASFEDLGKKPLKNIDRPVRMYRVVPEGGAPAKRTTGAPAWVGLVLLAIVIAGAGLYWGLMKPGDRGSADKEAGVEQSAPTKQTASDASAAGTGMPVVAVLPFTNFSDDKEQEYFSDGLTEDLITDISKVSGIRVIARNSSFAYKGVSQDLRKVGAELGASHIIEGSVRKGGGTVRINVQLINAADGTHVWAERYDRELRDIFAIQDEVVGQVIAMLSVKLTPEEKTRLQRHETENLDAHDLLLRGRRQESYFTPASNAEAAALYRQAIALDPDYANAHAHLSVVLGIITTFGNVEKTDELVKEALAAAEKAVALDPALPLAQFALGRILSRPQVAEYPRAMDAFKAAIRLNPSFADGYANLAFVSIFTGDAERATEFIEKAIGMNPRYPFWYLFARSMARYFTNDYQGAVADLTIAAERNPTAVFVRYWLAAALAQAGKIEDANWEVEEFRGMGNTESREEILKKNPISFAPYKEKLGEGLKKAGLE